MGYTAVTHPDPLAANQLPYGRKPAPGGASVEVVPPKRFFPQGCRAEVRADGTQDCGFMASPIPAGMPKHEQGHKYRGLRTLPGHYLKNVPLSGKRGIFGALRFFSGFCAKMGSAQCERPKNATFGW